MTTEPEAIRALVRKWRGVEHDPRNDYDAGELRGIEKCCDELEAALGSGPDGKMGEAGASGTTETVAVEAFTQATATVRKRFAGRQEAQDVLDALVDKYGDFLAAPPTTQREESKSIRLREWWIALPGNCKDGFAYLSPERANMGGSKATYETVHVRELDHSIPQDEKYCSVCSRFYTDKNPNCSDRHTVSIPRVAAWMTFGVEHDVWLPHHAGTSVREVEISIMDSARREGYTGTLAQRLKALHWEIRPVYGKEITP
jgi:hypothetical protein